jgi:hypothetical protein
MQGSCILHGYNKKKGYTAKPQKMVYVSSLAMPEIFIIPLLLAEKFDAHDRQKYSKWVLKIISLTIILLIIYIIYYIKL